MYDSNVLVTTVTIADGESLSGAATLSGRRLFGLILPSGWHTNAITFQASYDGDNYYDLFDKDGEYSIVSIAASKWITLNPSDFAFIPCIKVRSGTSGSPVNQSGSVSIGLVLGSV